MDRYLIQRHLFDAELTVTAVPCGEIVARILPNEEGYTATVSGSIVIAAPGESLEHFAERLYELRSLTHTFCLEPMAHPVQPAVDTLPLFL